MLTTKSELDFQVAPVFAVSQFDQLLEASAKLHAHLCPRQVLGVRMGPLAGIMLGIEVPQPKKRLITIIETDGCFTDGVAVATNCWVGRRTMFVQDFGKMAATFVDTRTTRGVRIAPRADARPSAQAAAQDARNRWEGYRLPTPVRRGIVLCSGSRADRFARKANQPGGGESGL